MKLYLLGLYYSLRRIYRQNKIMELAQILDELQSLLGMEEDYD